MNTTYPPNQIEVTQKNEKAYLLAEQMVKDRLWRQIDKLQNKHIGNFLAIRALEEAKDLLNDF